MSYIIHLPQIKENTNSFVSYHTQIMYDEHIYPEIAVNNAAIKVVFITMIKTTSREKSTKAYIAR